MKHLVFLPGTMGSFLFEGKNTIGKPQYKWFASRDKKVLRLLIDENGKSNEIYAGPPLSKAFSLVGLGGYIKPNIIYANIIENLRNYSEKKGYKFHELGYDWRKNINEEIVLDIHDAFKNFEDCEEIIVVAHSMGGLVIKAYLHWLKEKNIENKVKTVITIGTPWKGSPDAYQILMNGIENKLFYPNPEATKKIARTFPSVIQLLPSQNYCSSISYLHKDGKNLNWNESFKELEELEGLHIKNLSKINKDLYDITDADWAFDVDHHNIIGVQQGTLGTVPLGLVTENFLSLDGDETVPLFSAEPVNSKNSTMYYTKASHLGLVKYDIVLQLVQEILEKPSNSITKSNIIIDKIYEDGKYKAQEDWSYIKIDCPVDVYYENEEIDFDKHEQEMTKIRIGEAKYLIPNNQNEQLIEIEAFDEGTTQIELVQVKNREVISKTKVKTIYADPARKAVVKVSNPENVTNSIVLIESEYGEKPIEVAKIDVPLNKKIGSVPRTSYNFEKIGKSVNNIFDYNGLIIELKNVGEYVLDTFYRINKGEWKIYTGNFKFIPMIENVYGKVSLEYYSVDVFENREPNRSVNFTILPKNPKVKARLNLSPSELFELEFESYYEGINDYTYEYYLKEEKISDLSKLKLKDFNSIGVIARDIFGNNSELQNFDVNLTKAVEVLWDIEGYQGSFSRLSDLFDTEEIPKFKINGKTKELLDTLSSTAKSLIVDFDKISLNIELVLKYDIFLHYHSELISKKQGKLEFKFSVYSKDELVTDFVPKVMYTYIPKISGQDSNRAEVKEVSEGVYKFNVNTKYLPKVKKIKIEFKENYNSSKVISTQQLILE